MHAVLFRAAVLQRDILERNKHKCVQKVAKVFLVSINPAMQRWKVSKSTTVSLKVEEIW
jgi:hypothetical protein